MTTAIVTDTTACIPPELVERYGIEVVPLHIIFEGRTFVDSMQLDAAAFYDLLSRSKERPTTAAPSPGMFLEAIGRAGRRADTVLIITVSAQFSAMYDAARQAIDIARAEAPHLDLRLLDSRNAAMAQGFIVLEAARAAVAGHSSDDIVAKAQDMTSRVTLFAMLDTLTYLARSGRVPLVPAWAAGMLQVKPIVRFSASGIRLAARTRTRTRAKREDSWSAEPSRHVTVRQACFGRPSATFLAETSSGSSRRPVLFIGLSIRRGPLPGAHIKIVGTMPTT